MAPIEISGIRLRDIGPFGLLIAFGALTSLSWGAIATAKSIPASGGVNLIPLAIGGFFFVILGAMVYQEGLSPEFDGNCDRCGDRIVVNSGAERPDEYYKTIKTGAPKRASVFGYSMVLGTQREERAYCSPECAKADYVAVVATHDPTFPEETPAGQEVSD